MTDANSNLDTTQQDADNQTDDAKRGADEIGVDKGANVDKIKIPGVDVESDYKASKKYSVGSADRSSPENEGVEVKNIPPSKGAGESISL